MRLFIQGVLLGFIIVLPGMSGGTVFLIFGFYEKMIRDILKLYIKPYIPLIAGILLGIFVSGFTIVLFFENYRDITVSFLMGCLLASIRAVVKECPQIDIQRLLVMAVGVAIGWLLIEEPLGLFLNTEEVSWWLLIIGGALSSAAMIIPGLPGSSVLILLGIYDNILFSIKELDIMTLLFYGIGSLIGIFVLLKILVKIYEKYKALIIYIFAGLIVGSTRGLIPSDFNLLTVGLILIGFLIVWKWSGNKEDHTRMNECE